jgi:hypothetical protein
VVAAACEPAAVAAQPAIVTAVPAEAAAVAAVPAEAAVAADMAMGALAVRGPATGLAVPPAGQGDQPD